MFKTREIKWLKEKKQKLKLKRKLRKEKKLKRKLKRKKLRKEEKKDIIVSAGGDNVSPAKIENIINNATEIDQCMVYGDKKNYLVALIVVEIETKEEKVKEIVENVNKNLNLIEKIKKFVIINNEFTIENRMLTPTLKLKRKEIIKNYKQELENLYNN